MKKIALLIVFAFSTTLVFSQQELELLPDGIVIPRITNAQRPISPSIGHLVFNTDQDRFEYYSGTSWVTFSGAGISDRIEDGNANVIVDEGGTFFSDRISMKLKNVVAAQLVKNPDGYVGLEVNDPGNNIVIGNVAPINLSGVEGQNVVVGKFSGLSLNTGVRNVFNGYQSGNKNEEGSDNVAVGNNALQNNVTARANIAIGTDALKNLNTDIVSSPFGSDNVAIGYKSMESVGAASTGNVAIGFEAGNDNTVGSKNVFLGYNAGKGASKLDNALYINNKAGDNPLIFGDFTNNKVGINNNGSNLTDALNVDGASGQGALRVRIAGVTRLRVHSNGGVSIGENSTPVDTGGLKVHALRGVGSQPVFVDSGGNLARSDGEHLLTIPAHMFTQDYSTLPAGFSLYKVTFTPTGPLGHLPRVIAPINLPNGVTIKRIEVLYWDENDKIDVEACFRRVELSHNFFPGHEATKLTCDTTTTSASDLNTLTLVTNEVVDYDSFLYDVRIKPFATGIPVPTVDIVEVYNVKIFYEH